MFSTILNAKSYILIISDETPTQLDSDSETSLTTTTTTTITKPNSQLHRCLQSNVYYGVALKGGWTAGKFTDKGVVPDLKTCIDHCCDENDCDLVMLLSQKCFTIHCYSLDDCQTTPNGHAHIAYVSRDGYQISECQFIYTNPGQ